MLAGKTNEANAPFAEAVRLDPDLEAKTVKAGQMLAAQGQLIPSAAKFNLALWLNPGDADAHENLGLVLKQQGKTQEAEVHLREAARLRTIRNPVR